MNIRTVLLVCLCFVCGGCFDGTDGTDELTDTTPDDETPEVEAPPNILFIVVDDTGVDQYEAFGYGGATPPQTVSINALAEGGVRFRNVWSMPTCSPTRSTFFDGRYPQGNGVRQAIVSSDLANSQLSPYDLTTPELLRDKAGYTSALIGKMHLTGSDLNPDNHPLGDSAMRELGWDYFAGYLDGAPYPIDTTAGGIAPEGTYQCGMVPTLAVDGANGSDSGVCYFPDGSEHGEYLVMDDIHDYPTPGRMCVEMGGILDPSTTHYSAQRKSELDFEAQNGYYTGEWKINHADGSNETLTASDPGARGYRTILETDRAINWIKQTEEEKPATPWMLSLGFTAMHAPLQPPPTALLPHEDAQLSLLGCGTPVADQLSEFGIVDDSTDPADFVQSRAVANHMLEAVDHEIGRLLLETGVAEQQEDGSLRYNEDSNTVVIFTSDNGTYMPSVKLPFDPFRAKGTLYQSGVWVPLVVTGPESIVSQPDRDVEHMVNTTDLYRLFMEIAGIDDSDLPEAWREQLDAQPILPYLSNPGQNAIRSNNFTEQGTNHQAEPPAPCVVPAANMCVQIFPQKQVCEDQSGVWYGPGNDLGIAPLSSCCAVNQYLGEQGQPATELYPFHQSALRAVNHKLVRVSTQDCATNTLVETEEFYEINESTDPTTLKLDRQEDNLLATDAPRPMTIQEEVILAELQQDLSTLLDSGIDCPGDGNTDLIVDLQDLDEWAWWASPTQGGGLSSWYDFNHDGLTDEADRAIIQANLGNDCRP